MKAYSNLLHIIIPVILMLFSVKSLAQNKELLIDNYVDKKTFYFDYRGANAFEAAVGTSVINGDLPDPMFEIAFRVGYKRSLMPHLNIGLTYNKFNLAFKEVYNEGFMSFDINLEYLMSPYRKFSPFIFGGAGMNASNYFTQTATKFQGGFGFEIIATDQLGLRMMADYNYVLSDTLDGVVFGASDDTYWRIMVGTTVYFTGRKKKEEILKASPSIINSNPIIKDN